MGCCGAFLKVINGIMATFLGILGVALALLGGFVVLDNADDLFLETKSANNLNMAAISMLVLGALLFLVVFLGCCAICREAPVCMEIYGGVLVFLALIHFGIGGWIVSHYSSPITYLNLSNDFRGEVWHLYQARHTDPQPWDNVQNWFECCGYEGPGDYKYANLPKSCCPEGDHYCDGNNAFEEGCGEAVTDAFVGMNYILGLSSIGIGIVEIIGAILAFSVSCGVWRKHNLSW